MGTNTETHSCRTFRVRDLRTFSSKGDVSIKYLALGLENHVEEEAEPDGMEEMKEARPSNYSSTNTSINTEAVTACTWPA